MLDNIRLKKLENGYTVKYHTAVKAPAGNDIAGSSKEVYVQDKAALVEFIRSLIEDHVEI